MDETHVPLSNLMGSEDQEYYVAAMHEALIGELGKIGALTVKSRTSMMQYRSRVKPVPEIARELDVDALVEGSMFKSGDRVRVPVRLIRTRPPTRKSGCTSKRSPPWKKASSSPAGSKGGECLAERTRCGGVLAKPVTLRSRPHAS